MTTTTPITLSDCAVIPVLALNHAHADLDANSVRSNALAQVRDSEAKRTAPATRNGM
jgi:hypothetical protein